jgi:hypothetical protein
MLKFISSRHNCQTILIPNYKSPSSIFILFPKSTINVYL